MEDKSVSSLLRLADEALAAEDYAAAAQYANSAIEQDVQNSRAWEKRAAAAAGGAAAADSRMEEAVNAWMTALRFAPSGEAQAMRETVAGEFARLLQSELRAGAEGFAEAPDAENTESVSKTVSDGIHLQNLLTVLGGLSFDRGAQYTRLARQLSEAAVGGFETAEKAFGPAHSNMLRWQWEKYIDAGDACLLLLEKAVNFCRDSDLGKNICDRYMQIGERLMHSCAWKYAEDASADDPFEPDLTLTSGAKRIREEDIRRFRTIRGYFEANQVNRLCRELAAARADADALRAKEHYWQTHAEERAALEQEREKLLKTVADAEDLQGHLPISARLAETAARIALCSGELESLGFGKRKRKKELRQELEALQAAQMAQAEEEARIKKSLSWTCKKSRARIAEIKRIFAAPRGTLPAPAGCSTMERVTDETGFCVTPRQLFDHLAGILPAPYCAAGLVDAAQSQTAPDPVFAGLGPLWAGELKKDTADVTDNAVELQLFFAAKTPDAPLKAIVLQSAAACTADEGSLHSYGCVGACLLLSLLREPDQTQAEHSVLELRHGGGTRLRTEGLCLEYLCTEHALPNGATEYSDHILIRAEGGSAQ